MRGNTGHKSIKKIYVILTVAAFLCICTVLYYKTLELEKQETQYSEQLAKAQSKYDNEVVRTSEIEDRKAYVQTKKYAEEVAREKFGMVYKNEIIFTPQK